MKVLNEPQEEQLQEISIHLRQVRQEKSMRIEEIAAKTRIRLAFLQALEAGRFEDLPEPIYVQGFIRRYGDALGLDGIAIAQTFATHIFPIHANNSHILDKKRSIYIPLFVPYILLLVLASTGLVYTLNPRFTIDFLALTQNFYRVQQKKTISLPIASPSPVASPQTTPSSTEEL
ncbi:MAG: helix-turn-helix domain-containing protein [Gloeotrichia echinulata IR180]|nr:helix-turn-helix domain-containing protein [Gloeotrichia echinulata DEX184]